MQKEQMDYLSKLIVCFEQKNIFITNILDITKQLHVKTENDDVDFEDLLDKRGELMQRIDKCSALIKTTIDVLDDDNKAIIGRILAEEPPSDSDDRLVALHTLVCKYNAALHALTVSDKLTVESLKVRHSILKDKVNEARAGTLHQKMYNM